MCTGACRGLGYCPLAQTSPQISPIHMETYKVNDSESKAIWKALAEMQKIVNDLGDKVAQLELRTPEKITFVPPKPINLADLQLVPAEPSAIQEKGSGDLGSLNEAPDFIIDYIVTLLAPLAGWQLDLIYKKCKEQRKNNG